MQPVTEDELSKIYRGSVRGTFVIAGALDEDYEDEEEYISIRKARESNQKAYAFTVVDYGRNATSSSLVTDIFAAVVEEGVETFSAKSNPQYPANRRNDFFRQVAKSYREPTYGFNMGSKFSKNGEGFYQVFSVNVDVKSKIQLLTSRDAVENLTYLEIVDKALEEMVDIVTRLEGLARACYVIMQVLCLEVPLKSLLSILNVSLGNDSVLNYEANDVNIVLRECIEKLRPTSELLTLRNLMQVFYTLPQGLVDVLIEKDRLQTSVSIEYIHFLELQDNAFSEAVSKKAQKLRLNSLYRYQEIWPNLTKLSLIYALTGDTIESVLYFTHNPHLRALLESRT